MSDLVINVRQISNYPAKAQSDGTESLLIQTNGLGGPYQYITAADFVATALSNVRSQSLSVSIQAPIDDAGGGVFSTYYSSLPGGGLRINNYDTTENQNYLTSAPAALIRQDPQTAEFQIWLAGAGSQGDPITFNDVFHINVAGAAELRYGTLKVARDPSTQTEVATMGWVQKNTVQSFNNRNGRVTLNQQDVYAALCLDSPIASQNWVLTAIQSESVTVSDIAPPLSQGKLWFDSVSTQLFVGYDDGSTIQWVIAVNPGALTPGSGSNPTGPATGDLNGFYPGPQLATIGSGGTYTNPSSITVDTKGRVTAATSGSGGSGGLPSGSVPTGGDLTGSYPSPTLNMITTPGTYSNPTITIDAKGRITNAVAGSPGTGGGIPEAPLTQYVYLRGSAAWNSGGNLSGTLGVGASAYLNPAPTTSVPMLFAPAFSVAPSTRGQGNLYFNVYVSGTPGEHYQSNGGAASIDMDNTQSALAITVAPSAGTAGQAIPSWSSETRFDQWGDVQVGSDNYSTPIAATKRPFLFAGNASILNSTVNNPNTYGTLYFNGTVPAGASESRQSAGLVGAIGVSGSGMQINTAASGAAGSQVTAWSQFIFDANGQAWKAGGGTWQGLSDARIKEVLGDYSQGLNEVLQLNPKIYTFRNNHGDPNEERAPIQDTRTHIGLIAQEVEPVMPEMVSRGDGWIDGEPVYDMRTLDVSALTYALVNSIKQIDARLKALETPTRV